MAHQSRWNTPSNYRDEDRPYGRNQHGPRGRYGSRIESADDYGYNPARGSPDQDGSRWQHEQDYYGSAPYASADSSREYSASRHRPSDFQSDYGQRDYGHRDRGGYGQRSYGREAEQRYNAPYGAREEYRTYSGGQNYEQNYSQQAPSSYDRNTAQGYRDYGRDYADNERGFFARAGDEVKSWFGDDDAARRRERDQVENYGYASGSGYSADYRSDYRGKGPKDYFRSDDRIREDACDRLTDDGRIDATDVEVRVQQGEVTLSGSVADRNAKRRAEDCVERISGVKQVQNNLRVEPVTATSAYAANSSFEQSTYGANEMTTRDADISSASSLGSDTTTTSGLGKTPKTTS